jgi:4'-phosphopantetheinyl transferase
MAASWLVRSSADVPAGDAWLGPRERAVLAGLKVPKRREDWRLGRWTAKSVLGTDVEVLAAADGAPEAWRGEHRLPLSVSLSHRAGRALVVVDAAPNVVGCDLERLEPRSPAFVRDWLAPAEQRLAAGDRVHVPNLVWAAKEAAAKVRREGLRLDVRAAVTRLDGREHDGWRGLTVTWTREEGLVTHGWWREDDGFVLVVAASPAGPPPVARTAVEYRPLRVRAPDGSAGNGP